jgi:6-phosphofructokinase 2
MAVVDDIVTITLNPTIDLSTSVDRVVPVQKLRCKGLKRDPGGGGINVARVVRRLGAEVTAIYTMGGPIGDLLRQLVEQERIRSRPVRIAAQTRENVTVTEDDTSEQYRFVLEGPRIDEAEWRECLAAIETLEPFPKYLVASGSLAPGVPDDFYLRVARFAAARGARFILDASGAALKAALDGDIFLIKPNQRELADLVGRPLEDERAWIEGCRWLIERRGVSTVALTLGHQGAMLVGRDGAWRAPALPIKPVSAVGAGDSFLGGMVHSLASGSGLEDAFRCGIASGSAALLTGGTELSRREDTERLLADVTLHAI